MRNKMKLFFPKTWIALAVPFAIMALSILFGAGAAIGQSQQEPQTVTVTEPLVECQVVKRHTIQYVDRPVTVVEYVDRVEKIPMQLRNYQELEELKQWLVRVQTNTTTIYFGQPDVTVDCDDFALALQRKALEDGYMMSFQIIEPGKYNSLFESGKMPPSTLHAINLAIVGNSAYYIEPQTSEVVFAAQLD